MVNNIFLLLGPEEGEKLNFIKNLVKQKQAELGEKPEIYRYYPFETNILDVVTILSSGSLFSQYKFVILYNIESVKKVAELNLLIDYCKSPADDATLILTSDQPGLSSKRLSNCFSGKQKVVFWELNEAQKKGWVINYFKRRNLTLTAGSVNFLLELVENNTKDLKKECNKLSGFFSPGVEIREEDIEQYVYHSKQENVFTLFDKIAARNFPLALEILEKMVLSGEGNAIAIISGLLWQFRKVLSLKVMQERHYQSTESFKALRIMSKKSQRIYSLAGRNYSKKELKAILVLMGEYNVKFRSFRQDMHNLLLQLFLYQIIVKGGHQLHPEKTKLY